MQQLSALDATFLHIESAGLPQHVMAVLRLDPPADGRRLDLDRVRARVATRMTRIPAFGRRLRTVPFGLDAPYWVHDRDVRLEEHLHQVHCPAPGDDAALGRVVGQIAARRLDRSRPLWELHLVDGLAGGGSALVAKVHHSTVYGVSGVTVLATLLDLTADADADAAPGPEPLEPVPSPAHLLARAGRNSLHRPVEGARLVRAVSAAAAHVRGSARDARTALPFGAPRTVLNGHLTPARLASFAEVDLEHVLTIRRQAGVTVNDVVLAAISSALRTYLATRGGVPARALHAGVPMQTGAGSVDGTDRLTALLVPLVLDADTPLELLKRTAEATADSKRFSDSLGPQVVEHAVGAVPPLLLRGGAWAYERLHGSTLHPPLQSLIVSNVRGADLPLYFAGARVSAIHPLGPLLPGAALNVSVMSHDGALDIGVLCCPDIVADVEVISRGVRDAIEELYATLA